MLKINAPGRKSPGHFLFTETPFHQILSKTRGLPANRLFTKVQGMPPAVNTVGIDPFYEATIIKK
jgi:hypothetical protein